jgi:murein L,D-transpeptidase YafK
MIAIALVCAGTYIFLRSELPLVESARSMLLPRIYALLGLERTFAGPRIEVRLREKGFALGDPVVIRIFKEESELEIWLKKHERFQLALTYKICTWSGKLGPKLREGDGQSPEGFYFASSRQFNPRSAYHRAINIGFPNAYDVAHGRTGSFLMIHGSCVSIGCYAMTDTGIDDIYRLAEAVLGAGQASVPIHIFPFRMTPENLARHEGNIWLEYWKDLAEGDRLFLGDGIPPDVSVCGERYSFGKSDASCRPVSAWQ